VKPELLYEYITLRHNEHTVHSMCRVLHVSESGYYRSVRRTTGTKPWQLLLVKIREIYAETPGNRNYGVRRIQLALEQRGIRVSFSGVRRAMKRGGLLKSAPHRANSLTRADAAAQKAENLIQRDFSAQMPNQKWLTDITQVPCADGKLYVAAVLDCYNGEIIGLAMDNNMRKELCIHAFCSACQAQGASGMILHSDRGSQFTSADFRKVLARYGAVQSMSGTGRCYDNARMESFFATLKKEKLYQLHTEKLPMAQVKSVVFRYIMTYYNRQRIYTANPGGLPPVMFRQAARGLAA
jgi:putative transposase